MRKVIKKCITEKEVHDYNAIAISKLMLEKLLNYTRDNALSAEVITKVVAAMLSLTQDEGDTIDLDDFSDVLALLK